MVTDYRSWFSSSRAIFVWRLYFRWCFASYGPMWSQEAKSQVISYIKISRFNYKISAAFSPLFYHFRGGVELRIWRAIQDHRQNSRDPVPAPPIRLSRLNSQTNNQPGKVRHMPYAANCHCETCVNQNGVNGEDNEDVLWQDDGIFSTWCQLLWNKESVYIYWGYLNMQILKVSWINLEFKSKSIFWW